MNKLLPHNRRFLPELDRIKSVLVYIYVFFLPLSDWLPVKICSILIMIALVLWIYDMMRSANVRKTWNGKTFPVLASIFFIQLFSFFHGGNQADLNFNLMVKLPFLLFPLIWNQYSQVVFFEQIKKYFIAGTILACLLSFRFLLVSKNTGPDLLNYHNVEHYLVLHRPYFGIYILICLCFLMDDRQWSVRNIILSGCFITFLVWMQAKTAIVLLALIYFVHVAFHSRSSIRRILMIVSSLSLLVIVTGSFLYYRQHRNELDTSAGFKRFFILSFNTRIVHTECALNILRDYPLTGVGAGHARAMMDQCYNTYHAYTPDFTRSGKIFNAHNEGLEEGLRHGLLGMLVFSFSFLFFFRKAIQKKDKLYLQFLLIVVIASMTESLFSRSQGVLLIAFFNCLFYTRLVLPVVSDKDSRMSKASD